MVEILTLQKGEKWSKEYFFENEDYLTSKTSCNCTATKQVEALQNGFKITIEYNATKVGVFSQWVKIKTTKNNEIIINFDITVENES